jgi:hypothetical protein
MKMKVGLALFFIGCAAADSEVWLFPLVLILAGGLLMKLGEKEYENKRS